LWQQLGRPPALTRVLRSIPADWHFQLSKAGGVGVCMIMPQDFDLVEVHNLEALAPGPL
jgi:hypothetical protein